MAQCPMPGHRSAAEQAAWKPQQVPGAAYGKALVLYLVYFRGVYVCKHTFVFMVAVAARGCRLVSVVGYWSAGSAVVCSHHGPVNVLSDEAYRD